MRILLAGAAGQLGRELQDRCRAFPAIDLRAPPEAVFDITRPDAVEAAIEASSPALIINAAAYTNVDRAEEERALAFAINRDGVDVLARAAQRHALPLFHISTDYVFGGDAPEPYAEDDVAAPLGVYGESKWLGEECLRAAQPAHLILRVSWLFGYHGHNFVKTIRRLAGEREELRVVADQHGCPTPASDLALALLGLAERLAAQGALPWGTYHYGGQPPTTWFGFAEEIVRLCREREALAVRTLRPIPTDEFPTPARRPRRSLLDGRKFTRAFGTPLPDWRPALAELIRRLCGESPDHP